MNPGDRLYVTVRYNVEFSGVLFKKGHPYPATYLYDHSLGEGSSVQIDCLRNPLSIVPPSHSGNGSVLQIHPLTVFNKNLEEILE